MTTTLILTALAGLAIGALAGGTAVWLWVGRRLTALAKRAARAETEAARLRDSARHTAGTWWATQRQHLDRSALREGRRAGGLGNSKARAA